MRREESAREHALSACCCATLFSLTLQKWSKTKNKEKLGNAVTFDQKTHERLIAEIPKVRGVQSLLRMGAVAATLDGRG